MDRFRESVGETIEAVPEIVLIDLGILLGLTWGLLIAGCGWSFWQAIGRALSYTGIVFIGVLVTTTVIYLLKKSRE